MFAFFIDENTSIDSYLGKMRKDGEQATEIEFKAICEALSYDL